MPIDFTDKSDWYCRWIAQLCSFPILSVVFYKWISIKYRKHNQSTLVLSLWLSKANVMTMVWCKNISVYTESGDCVGEIENFFSLATESKSIENVNYTLERSEQENLFHIEMTYNEMRYNFTKEREKRKVGWKFKF